MLEFQVGASLYIFQTSTFKIHTTAMLIQVFCCEIGDIFKNISERLLLYVLRLCVSFSYYYFCILSRSSPTKVFFKKLFFLNFAKFTRKHLCWSLFFSAASSFIKIERPWHRCFPVNFYGLFKNIPFNRLGFTYPSVLLLC